MVSWYRVLASEEDDESKSLADVKVSVFLTTFFRNTSMAGFPQVVTSPGIIRKIFWIISIAGMAFLLWWECSEFFKKFLAFAPVTAVSVEAARRLPFPAVTLCNNNPVGYDWYDPDSYSNDKMPPAPGPSGGATSGPAPAPGPGTTAAPSPGPGTTAAPAPGPGTTAAPAPGPGTTAAPAPGPGTTAAPAPGPGTTAAPAPGPGTSAAPPPAPPGRRRRSAEVSEEPHDRVKRQAPPTPMGGSNTGSPPSGGGPAGGGPAGAPQMNVQREQFTGHMQTILEIQERASQVAYENRSSTGHQLCDMILDVQYKGEQLTVES